MGVCITILALNPTSSDVTEMDELDQTTAPSQGAKDLTHHTA